jgi:hypothetical protein
MVFAKKLCTADLKSTGRPATPLLFCLADVLCIGRKTNVIKGLVKLLKMCPFYFPVYLFVYPCYVVIVPVREWHSFVYGFNVKMYL